MTKWQTYEKILFFALVLSTICMLDTEFVFLFGIASPEIEGNSFSRNLFLQGEYFHVALYWGLAWCTFILITMLSSRVTLRIKNIELNGGELLVLFVLSIMVFDISTHILFWLNKVIG